jgi:hypothetical protein
VDSVIEQYAHMNQSAPTVLSDLPAILKRELASPLTLAEYAGQGLRAMRAAHEYEVQVCIYICVYVCMYLCMYLCIYIFIPHHGTTNYLFNPPIRYVCIPYSVWCNYLPAYPPTHLPTYLSTYLPACMHIYTL